MKIGLGIIECIETCFVFCILSEMRREREGERERETNAGFFLCFGIDFPIYLHAAIH